ncbi:hypothetical protein [Chlamydiifrater phoenicopteri]|uniref:hypothetical protein n=1 Tax=Chlamydiifrater phoenicopteri TaxID=2681469 RepID=UPI001BCFDC56|nr:hypothetical protein [Chlamydiifrater phoenicopteri]
MSNTERKPSLDQGSGVDSLVSLVEKNASESVVQTLNSIDSLKDKLTYGIEVMRKLLSNTASIDWKIFWDVRKICLPLFHDLSDSVMRASLWKEYVELTKEARHLKICQEEESSFTISQIDLAITSLESDIKSFCEGGAQFSVDEKDFAIFSETKSLSGHFSFYKEKYVRSIWLGSFAARIAGLRRELSEVPIRVKAKSEFFRRLFALGNVIFPMRKSITGEVSDLFSEDVAAFVQQHFKKGASRDSFKRSLFALRREIKSLQSAAKLLAVNSEIFSSTRLQLSECWNSLKGLEKEIRQEQGELKQASVKYVKEVEDELAKIVADVESGVSAIQSGKELDRISRKMRSASLVYSDVQLLKAKIKEVYEKIQSQREKEEKANEEAKERILLEQKESLRKFIDGVKSFREKVRSEGEAFSAYEESLDELRKMFSKMDFLSQSEALALEKDLSDCEEEFQIFQEERLLQDESLEDSVGKLAAVMDLKENRRKQLKQALEGWKKLVGGSGLSFEQAIHYGSLIQEGKEKLAKLEGEISSLKQKMAND